MPINDGSQSSHTAPTGSAVAAATVLAGEIAIIPFVTLNKKLQFIWNSP